MAATGSMSDSLANLQRSEEDCPCAMCTLKTTSPSSSDIRPEPREVLVTLAELWAAVIYRPYWACYLVVFILGFLLGIFLT